MITNTYTVEIKEEEILWGSFSPTGEHILLLSSLDTLYMFAAQDGSLLSMLHLSVKNEPVASLLPLGTHPRSETTE